MTGQDESPVKRLHDVYLTADEAAAGLRAAGAALTNAAVTAWPAPAPPPTREEFAEQVRAAGARVADDPNPYDLPAAPWSLRDQLARTVREQDPFVVAANTAAMSDPGITLPGGVTVRPTPDVPTGEARIVSASPETLRAQAFGDTADPIAELHKAIRRVTTDVHERREATLRELADAYRASIGRPKVGPAPPRSDRSQAARWQRRRWRDEQARDLRDFVHRVRLEPMQFTMAPSSLDRLEAEYRLEARQRVWLEGRPAPDFAAAIRITGV